MGWYGLKVGLVLVLAQAILAQAVSDQALPSACPAVRPALASRCSLAHLRRSLGSADAVGAGWPDGYVPSSGCAAGDCAGEAARLRLCPVLHRERHVPRLAWSFMPFLVYFVYAFEAHLLVSLDLLPVGSLALPGRHGWVVLLTLPVSSFVVAELLCESGVLGFRAWRQRDALHVNETGHAGHRGPPCDRSLSRCG